MSHEWHDNSTRASVWASGVANECTHTYMTYIWQIYTIYIYLYIYVQLALRIHGCLRVTVSRRMCYVYSLWDYDDDDDDEKWWENDDISVMRIARYCTSVLISGRTIPVDVTLTTSSSFFLGSRVVSRQHRTGANPVNDEPRISRINFLILVFLCYSINCLLVYEYSAMAVETGGCEDGEKMKYTVSRIRMLYVCIYRVYIVNLYS